METDLILKRKKKVHIHRAWSSSSNLFLLANTFLEIINEESTCLAIKTSRHCSFNVDISSCIFFILETNFIGFACRKLTKSWIKSPPNNNKLVLLLSRKNMEENSRLNSTLFIGYLCAARRYTWYIEIFHPRHHYIF